MRQYYIFQDSLPSTVIGFYNYTLKSTHNVCVLLLYFLLFFIAASLPISL